MMFGKDHVARNATLNVFRMPYNLELLPRHVYLQCPEKRRAPCSLKAGEGHPRDNN